MIRLLIVEDQMAVRKGLHMRLDAEADISVVGESSDGEAVLDLVLSLHPDVVLVDVEMPGMDGIAVTSVLHRIYPQASVVILSIHDDPFTRAQAENAGAVAFVPKSLPTDLLLETIRRVAPSGGLPVVD